MPQVLTAVEMGRVEAQRRLTEDRPAFAQMVPAGEIVACPLQGSRSYPSEPGRAVTGSPAWMIEPSMV